MSSHAITASEDSADENHYESYEEPVPEIDSESSEEPVPDIHSEGKRKPDAEIHSESYETSVAQIHSQSKGKPVAETHSRSKRKPDAEVKEPAPEFPSWGKRKPRFPPREKGLAPQIPSKGKRVKDPAPEIPSKGKRKPRSKTILRESERDLNADSGDGQQRLRVRKPAHEIPSTSKRKPKSKKILRASETDSNADSGDGQERLPGPSLHGKKPRRWMSEEEWLDIMKKSSHGRLRSLSNVSIFKIPDFLKDTKRESYVPQRVLLGPYYHGSKKIRAMDDCKARALTKMRDRFNKKMHSTNDEHFASFMIELILKEESKIRDSYEESIHCDGICLARMLSVDGCFILEVLKSLDEKRLDDSIFGEKTVTASNALNDILMLENQIPCIVLQLLLLLENPKDGNVETTLLNVMVRGTCGLFKISSEDKEALFLLQWLRSPARKVHHLLDFVHKVIVNRPPFQPNPGDKGEHRISIGRCIGRCLQMLQDKNKALNHDFESIPPAVELKNAGIKFQPCNGGIQQIKFIQHSSTIYLPLLSITCHTEVLFRNLIALEMCRSEMCRSELNYFISYVNLMDDLIDSQKDVAFLRSMGILTNLLGSDQEVADLFNRLFKGVSLRFQSEFDEVRKNVNANYKNRIRVQLAELSRDHFSSPWKIIALAVAFAILCLTLLQTIYTIKHN